MTTIVNDRGFIEKGIAPKGATHTFRSLRSAEASAGQDSPRKYPVRHKQGRLTKREVNRLHSSRDEKYASECVEYLRPDPFGTDETIAGCWV